MAAATEPPARAARLLLRAARSGTLATVAAGQPFASLVTPAVASDLSVVLLLSSLAQHTRHLRADGRCALMVAGTPEGANPQTAPRLTVTGTAVPDPDPALKARWLAVHPYGALYADFADFAIWRLVPAQALLVSGFARADRLRRADLAADAAAVATLAAAAPALMAEWNRDRPDALAAIAAAAGDWRLVGLDVDGCDLAAGERVLRIAWEAPIEGPDRVAAELGRLAATGRWTTPG
jgi:heme iron utilization protein